MAAQNRPAQAQARGTAQRGGRKTPVTEELLTQEQVVEELSQQHRELRNTRPAHDPELLRVADQYTSASTRLSAMRKLLEAGLTPEEAKAISVPTQGTAKKG